MAHRKTLNEKQLAVLRWVADGCPAGVQEGSSHRITAAALRRRDLVRTSGRGSTWRAKITRAGRDYLERAAGPDPPVPRQAGVSVTEQLVNEVLAAGGSLRVPQTRYGGRGGVDFENRALLAERHGKVPEGRRLRVRAVGRGELQIDLVEAPEGTAIAPRPVPVPDRVGRYHPVVLEFRARAERHEVSRAALPRASRLLQALVVEAERRGHHAEVPTPGGSTGYQRLAWTGARDGHLVIAADGCPSALRVTEEGLASRAHWESRLAHRRSGRAYKTAAAPSPGADYEAPATGRLRLEIVSGGGSRGRPARWSDRRSWTVEEKLPDVLCEIEIRAAEHRHRQREAERQAAERERAWREALERARERYAEAQREEKLRAETRSWREAREIRAYCEAAEAAYPDVPCTSQWVSWARHLADELDPLKAAPRPPAAPEAVSPEELRPYLEGWDPYGPDRVGRRSPLSP